MQSAIRNLKSATLLSRSLRFYARSHIGTLLGVAVAAAVLVGALAVGDSVRESLRQMGLNRLGRTEFALASRDRFFRAALANDFSNAAPALQLPGIAASPDGTARANHVQVLGVDEGFWKLALTPVSPLPPGSNTVLLNAPLAHQLHVNVGDTILLRVQKPSLLSSEAPISPREDVSTGFRLPVSAIISEAELGRFSLQANQAAPLNAFVPLKFLQANLDLAGKANLLLLGSSAANPADQFRQHWTPADAELQLRDLPDGMELRSARVFIDPPVIETLNGLSPTPQYISTYFVNELRAGEKTTPYSMVTAASAPLVPTDMPDDEILITQWLADDLQAKPGDQIQLTYFIIGANHRLEEKHDTFRVRAILPVGGITDDRTLMPDFPGLAKAEKTENWDAGFPIDMKKIRPKDEQYWKDFRGTPKAFVTLKAGQKMWANRFGNFTAIRFPGGVEIKKKIADTLQSKLDPAALGLTVQPVRAQALAASTQSEDFGQYFLAFSFFLIVAALILLGLLFQFGLEQRATEIGLLLALGWRPGKVRRALLLEGAIIALIGGALGVAGGILYAKGILYGLATIWSAAVAESALQFHVTATTLAVGALSAVIMSTGVIWLALRRQSKRPARELLERGHELEQSKPKRRWAGWLAIGSAVGALGLIASAFQEHDSSVVEAFFGGATLLLIAGLAAAAVLLRRLKFSSLTSSALAWRNCTLRPKRSLATIALLASGIFLIVAVEANKLDATRDSQKRSSGTGDFAFIGESSLPIIQDLNSKEGRDFFGLESNQLNSVAIVPLRVRDGDDASCLNLNHPQTPRILGVKTESLQSRQAFTFTEQASQSWQLLTNRSDAVPAIADATSLEYSLHKKVGDTLDYTDAHGKTFKLQIVGSLENSILQGSLIIDEAEFVKHFPDESGYRMFLVDAPSKEATAVAATLSRALQDRGLELTATAERLNAFNAVQNTYLNTFQVLGGLGLLLGSAGLGVVVLRNVLERRDELALLLAVGYRPPVIRRLIFTEHTALLAGGLVIGLLSALIALAPVFSTISYRYLILTLSLMLASGMVWTWLAARLALRGQLIKALNNE